MINYILAAAGVLLIIAGVILRRLAIKKQKAHDPPDKRDRKRVLLWTIITVIGAYMLLTRLITIIFGAPEGGGIEVSIWAERVNVFGLNLSTTIIYTWVVMAVLVLAALILRIIVVSRMKDVPTGAQNILELAIETACTYTKSKAEVEGDGLVSYIFTVAAYLVACAGLELFGLRAPTADITQTFALALVTFVLINYYGIKKKGVGGRIKSLSSPTPMVFPIRVICDCAIPVSMACRLFGNMLGGMIVMDLLYTSLGNNAIGIPSVVGIYFNVFHPLIQAFIFVTLTLTFINEATE